MLRVSHSSAGAANAPARDRVARASRSKGYLLTTTVALIKPGHACRDSALAFAQIVAGIRLFAVLAQEPVR